MHENGCVVDFQGLVNPFSREETDQTKTWKNFARNEAFRAAKGGRESKG